ncbi:DUF1707 domain-containing protein [Rhodococcus sp. IEGM 1366]|uniref:DUF1707 SHOCT-like domain-containing protein n=1 Tax=Rhodococcus sp. IEGM 1366 TaxID=3082223 RepID=UPI002954D582|nr:DUF1707 domain-containing protein [Rhodococcus sp. IEGM 1366]MDV8071136.1 DUF1707 domain-containing protein [Rhodococcus sp. IEGM 1366]
MGIDKRAGAEDRERVSEQLIQAMSHGYINPSEYSDRAAAVANATHMSQLSALTEDLPNNFKSSGKHHLPVKPLLAVGAVAVIGLVAAGLTLGGTNKPEQTGISGEGSVAADKATGDSSPASDSTATVLQAGFGQVKKTVWVSAEVENLTGSDGAFAVANFNLFDGAGNLVKTASHTERFGYGVSRMFIGTIVSLDDGIIAEKVEATANATVYSTGSAPDFNVILKIGEVQFAQADFRNEARVPISNPSDQVIPSARVAIACFNVAGQIIGGGSTFPNSIAAQGTVLAETPVYVAGIPSRCSATAVPSKY